MLHHDYVVLFLAWHEVSKNWKPTLLELFSLIPGSLVDRAAHGLELAVKECIAVRELICFDIFAEKEVSVLDSSDVSLPFSQSRHPGPNKAKLRKVLTAHRV